MPPARTSTVGVLSIRAPRRSAAAGGRALVWWRNTFVTQPLATSYMKISPLMPLAASRELSGDHARLYSGPLAPCDRRASHADTASGAHARSRRGQPARAREEAGSSRAVRVAQQVRRSLCQSRTVASYELVASSSGKRGLNAQSKIVSACAPLLDHSRRRLPTSYATRQPAETRG